MNGIKKRLPSLKYVHKEEVVLEHSFEKIAAFFANDFGTTVLLSGTDLDCSRYHILAVDPWLDLTFKSGLLRIRVCEHEVEIQCDPFNAVETIIEHFNYTSKDESLPVQTGLFGYFSYDLKDRIEKLPQTCADSHLPDLCLFVPSNILVHDKKLNKTFLQVSILEQDLVKTSIDDLIKARMNSFFQKIDVKNQAGSFSIDGSGFRSSFSKFEYVTAVNKIIDYLRAGDIYQANLSQKFKTGFEGDAYALFLDLYKRNPAPFFSFVNAGSHKIVSTSPERFIKQKGCEVETRPIKGTIARGKTPKADDLQSIKLSKSIKDDAELTMIVDLMRNDLSRVTKHGSVIVEEHKRLEAYDNVFHLVSIVKGELKKDQTCMDLLKATFPGGSITGCPKIRSMEIIDELEPVKRHVYTGSIGYLSFHSSMDLSIAIRTATIFNNEITFSVGGGIVYDSDPEKEFQETLDKGKTIMDSLSFSAKKKTKFVSKAWINGKILDQNNAFISANSPGFQYGAGIFETIRAENGKVFRLKDHILRFNRTWEQLFNTTPPDITWEDVISQLLKENKLDNRTSAIKIMAALDDEKHFCAAFARKYVHRLEILKKEGLDLVTYPEPRQSPLADHKTLNYLYYYLAGRYARQKSADEAVILNPDLTVSETNTCSILIIDSKRVILPDSDHVLPGITLKKILEILSKKDYEIIKTKIRVSDFLSLDTVILTNALMGAVPVLSIDQNSINDLVVKNSIDFCRMINTELFLN